MNQTEANTLDRFDSKGGCAMRVTRRNFVAGISAAVLADWPAGVFAGGARRPFGAAKRHT
jgi:hypothetical protein